MSIDNFYDALRGFEHEIEDIDYLLNNNYIVVDNNRGISPPIGREYYIVNKPFTFCNNSYYRRDLIVSIPGTRYEY